MSTALLSFNPSTFSSTAADVRLQRSVWYMGNLMTIHADASDTGGAYALFEASGGPGAEPPMHVHEREDELFYLLEGQVLVTRGNEQILLEAGESVLLPRHIPHTFRVLSPHARMLVYLSVAGLENYFREIGRPAQHLGPDPNPPKPDFARMQQVSARYGIQFLV